MTIILSVLLDQTKTAIIDKIQLLKFDQTQKSKK